MGWLDRVMSTVFREQLAGLRLDDPHPYAFRLPPDGARFLRALPVLLPPTAMLYCEGTTDPHVARWLERQAIRPAPARIALGTLWPKPDCYHVPLRKELIDELAALVETHGVALPSIHVHAYDDQVVLVQWHDAFLHDPVFVSRSVPADRVEAFVAATDARALVA